MIRQPLSFVCMLVISFITIGCNLVLINSDTISEITGDNRKHDKVQEGQESFKTIHKRNAYDEFGNLDLYYKSATKEPKSKVWFQVASPTPPAHALQSTDDMSKDLKFGERVQGLQHLMQQAMQNYSSRIGLSSDDSISINYIGCFSTWEKQYTVLRDNDLQKYDDSQLHITCANKCRQMGNIVQISFVKGAECLCAPIHGFNSSLKRESYCNIPCPLKDFTSQMLNLELPRCGGNQGYSVYCISGPESCNSVLENAEVQRKAIEKGSSELMPITERKPKPIAVLHNLCTQCNYTKSTSTSCRLAYTLPDFDYFPLNSPQKCVEYCGTTVRYVTHGNHQERERLPTPYALLTWWDDHGTQLPICRCISETTLEAFKSVENPSECDMTCPGDSNEICGGKERDNTVFGSVYCVDRFGDGRCGQFTTTTTPNSLPPAETEDPCNDENYGCDPDPGVNPDHTTNNYTTWTEESTSMMTESTTEDEPQTTPETTTTENEPGTPPKTTTTEEPRSTTVTTEEPRTTTSDANTTDGSETTTTDITTTDDPMTTTDLTSTTEATTTTPEMSSPAETTFDTTTPNTTSSTTSSYTTTTTTVATSITTTTPRPPSTTSPSCIEACVQHDRNGNLWEACPGKVARKPCKSLNGNANATGIASWKCLESGFETPQPNVANCSSAWLEEKHEQVEKIENIQQAQTFVKDLHEACTNAALPNSTTKYYGHEIKGITSIVELTVTKAREFLTEPSFDDLEVVVEKAVELYAFLMQYHDPWKDFSNFREKSMVSSDIIDNTEEALFNLTHENPNKNYNRSFRLGDTERKRFLLFAETFDKKSNDSTNKYEFPSKTERKEHDSYIKLPDGWIKYAPHSQIEIAAMSIDAEYISNVMPGQYNLVSNYTLNGANSEVKLINGQLISLTLMTDNPPSQTVAPMFNRQTISFTGKGVEITFHHDIEAWGKDVQDVQRYLHEGELPKAVLGSSKCVFWNPRTYNWSTDGCKILKANRYETVCECNHLTSFAILMDVHRYVGKEFGLELLTLILCPASEVALFLSIIILSSVNGLQRFRAIITRNLSLCLLVGNGLVLFVLDRNYFNMNKGVCTAAAMVTHYVFLCAFMWMLIEGIQLYRMVVHVFDSGRSYMKHFGILAYGSPLIVVAITATVGYLNEDEPYGGDVYCWLEGPYIWSFMGPVAVITAINIIILCIALKIAYQVQQSKKHTPVFIMGKIRSYKTWFKGCFSLTVLLGLTWVVGFFLLMKSPTGLVAAYIFTVLNASQGLFIFFFNCVFNEKVRTFTQRNLSTYLPSWLSSSVSSNPGGNDGSLYGKRPSSLKSGGESVLQEKSKKRTSARRHNSNEEKIRPVISSPIVNKEEDESAYSIRRLPRITKVNFVEAKNTFISADIPVQRSESIGTISSLDSIPNSNASENGHISSDNSQSAMISKVRF